MIHINSLDWWLVILLNLFGYFIFRFGSSKNGLLSHFVEFIGGTVLVLSFVLMGFVFGLKEVVALVFIFMLPVTLLNELLFFRGKLVKRQKDSVANDLKMLEETIPGITKGDKEFRKWIDTEMTVGEKTETK